MPIVATAGHVDHGKSTLVQALTGRDPDRWTEEKERGLTIDLGFAWTELGEHSVGFVDVPGHERFIKNMLAGVGGLDVALLVVAADEGWMPQTEEHLVVLDLLDVRNAVVALTRVDLADADMAELAALEIEEHLAATSLAGSRIVPVSAVAGTGMEELRSALGAALNDSGQPHDVGRPRLWVDRSFTISGAGTVV
ncbi:MAG: GTP-binding protein, partial [Acidimicrobiia bacterium]|nr:GTP-binding protein [Acidimicrobiia bacterium]